MANWTDLSASFAYGTKLTSTQMQQLRDNITATAEGAAGAPDILEAAIVATLTATFAEINTACDGSTARNSHVHSNITISAGTGLSGGGALDANRTITHAAHTGDVTGATALTIASAVVSQAKLKTSSGSVGTTNDEVITVLPGGEYGFSHLTRINNVSTDAVAGVLLGRHTVGYEDIAGIDDWFWALDRAVGFTDTGTTAAITLYSNSASAAAYATQRYVTASGEVHWIFLLKDKTTGEITCMWESPDHPCFGNGGKPLLMPHPFLNFDPATQEIICINPTDPEVKKIREAMVVKDDGKHNLNFIEAFRSIYDIDEATEPTWTDVEVTVGLPDNWEDLPVGSKIESVKKSIPKPAMVRKAGLKVKAKGMQS